MKKIVALGAIAALLSGMIFADEPAINTSIADFTGNAEVKWGVDLDAGQHGFSNSTDSKLKVNLWDGGTKETSGDDIWAELKIEAKAGAIENKADGTAGLTGDALKAPEIKEAKIHISDFYVDIRSGNTQVGEYKPNMALHSDSYAWLKDNGLNFTQGIQAGYDVEAFKFSLDFRSYEATATKLTSAYGIEFDASLKDNLVPGLTVDAGVGVNLSTEFVDTDNDKIEGETADGNEQTDVDAHAARIPNWDKGQYVAKDTNSFTGLKDGHQIAYGIKAGYKLDLDGMYLQPTLGFRGSYTTGQTKVVDSWKPSTNLENELAFGVMFGWGEETNKDAAAGVPYLNDNGEKKLNEGVSVVAYIPLASVGTLDDVKTTEKGALTAVIVPAFYLGESKVEGLKAAAYGEIGIYNFTDAKEYDAAASLALGKPVLKSSTEKDVQIQGSAKENETTALAIAAGVAYGYAMDDITITPKAGFRYVNGAYVANNLGGVYSDIFKSNLGFQRKYAAGTKEIDKGTYDGDFFNLTLGVDVGGLINNTTFSVEYASANLLNDINYKDEYIKANGEDKTLNPYYNGYKENGGNGNNIGWYNVRAGEFTVGAKISF